MLGLNGDVTKPAIRFADGQGIYRTSGINLYFALSSALAGGWVTTGGINQFRLQDGSVGTPSISFLNDTDTGFYRISGNRTGVVGAGNLIAYWDGGAGVIRHYYRTTYEDGSSATPSITFNLDGDTGLFRPTTNQLSISAGGATAASFDASTTAGDTRFLIYDVDNGTLERVTVGAADSGGTGFKVLRIPN